MSIVLRNDGDGMKLYFYIDNDADAERCKESFHCKKPVTIGGTDTLTGRIRSYTGVILSVEERHTQNLGERWRIAIDSEISR